MNPTSSYKLDLTAISLQGNMNHICLSKINCQNSPFAEQTKMENCKRYTSFITAFLLGPSLFIYLSFSFFVLKADITYAHSDAVTLIHVVFANTWETILMRCTESRTPSSETVYILPCNSTQFHFCLEKQVKTLNNRCLRGKMQLLTSFGIKHCVCFFFFPTVLKWTGRAKGLSRGEHEGSICS